METVSENKCFGGVQGVYRHASAACGVDMTFGLYLPPAAEAGPVPLLWWLSGLTCTHENAMTKAGFQRDAAALGLAVVYPDTSPRGEGVADDESFDLGQGAGFYVDATETPWAPHFNMKSYILEDLSTLLAERFPIDPARQGVSGHSMGGHGALTLAMGAPERFKSLSAVAPIANPTGADWGRKQLSAYLGPDESRWVDHDASLLIKARGWKDEILIDQGEADPFLGLLKPEALEAALAESGQPARMRRRAGYDHSYFFVASVGPEHLRFHADRLA